MDPQPLGPGILVALFDIALTPEHRRHKAQAEADFLRPAQHVVVSQDRCHTIHRGWQIREIKAAVSAWFLLLIEDHRVALPLQPVFDVQLFEDLKHVRVGPEKDMEPGLVPVTVLVFPGCNLATEHIASLHHHWRMANIGEIFGAGQTRKTGSGDSNPHAAGSRLKSTLKELVPLLLLKVLAHLPV